MMITIFEAKYFSASCLNEMFSPSIKIQSFIQNLFPKKDSVRWSDIFTRALYFLIEGNLICSLPQAVCDTVGGPVF